MEDPLRLSLQVLWPRLPGSLVGAGGLDQTLTETHYEHWCSQHRTGHGGGLHAAPGPLQAGPGRPLHRPPSHCFVKPMRTSQEVRRLYVFCTWMFFHVYFHPVICLAKMYNIAKQIFYMLNILSRTFILEMISNNRPNKKLEHNSKKKVFMQ